MLVFCGEGGLAVCWCCWLWGRRDFAAAPKGGGTHGVLTLRQQHAPALDAPVWLGNPDKHQRVERFWLAASQRASSKCACVFVCVCVSFLTIPCSCPSVYCLLSATGLDRHSRPEFLYFWFYFVIINGIWIAVPLACILYACRHINSAVAR